MGDSFDLDRFIRAQDGVLDAVCDELRAGRKQTHWMWFVFPQIAGLGHSEMARKYAISSLDEARAYLDHPVLGRRLHQCCELVLHIEDRSASEIFGHPDDMKFHSSVTLFASAAEPDSVFNTCLQKFFAGRPDEATLLRL